MTTKPSLWHLCKFGRAAGDCHIFDYLSHNLKIQFKSSFSVDIFGFVLFKFRLNAFDCMFSFRFCHAQPLENAMLIQVNKFSHTA